VHKFAEKYINPRAFPCKCGRFWVKSAQCGHNYTGYDMHCGKTPRLDTLIAGSTYCPEAEDSTHNLDFLTVKMLCEGCQFRKGKMAPEAGGTVWTDPNRYSQQDRDSKVRDRDATRVTVERYDYYSDD
jgi:hypothetical protein